MLYFCPMSEYEPATAEPKWQQAWQQAGVYKTDFKQAKKPFYSLVMFPYPSGDKLHVGHWYNYAPADSYARFKKMQGFDVFSPMGFDAFGLPAENYAIKTGVHPAESTAKNVRTMIGQLKRIGCMYDWDQTLSTTDPGYYRWTQWLFLEMYKHKLAYKKLGNVNFCPKDQTVLANEQCQDGKCERCGTEVIQKPLEQWFWSIKQYSAQLLDGLENLDWPKKTKIMQQNWIGRSDGAEVSFDLINVFRGTIGPINFNSGLAIVSNATNPVVLTGDLNRRLTDGWKGRIHSPRTCHIVFPPYKRAHSFDAAAEAQRIISILDRVCDRHDIVLHEAAAMPDHVHLLISFESKRHLEMDIIKKLKGASAREFLKKFDGADSHLWAEGKHFDDVLDDQQFQRTLAYIQNNLREAGVSSDGRILSRLPVEIRVFTTRPDTLFGVTYLVLAPEHSLVEEITTPDRIDAVKKYSELVAKKTEIDRTDKNSTKTGEFTGAYVINPVNNEKIPIWIADYALVNYGTGAVMAVPGHDERDYDFIGPRLDSGLKIKNVIDPQKNIVNFSSYVHESFFPIVKEGDSLEQAQHRIDEIDYQLILKGEKCWTGPGTIVNSDFLNGLDVEMAKKKMIEWLEKNKVGKRIVTYRLRDWLVSRQRYWGAPIPIVYDPQGQAHPVPEEHLPWLLPTDVEFKPTGKSPLTESKEFIARTEQIFGKGWRPEFDTMDTFVCSSFYYLRYLMASSEDMRHETSDMRKKETLKSQNSSLKSPKKNIFVDLTLEKKWLPVGMYIGGPEHACMHLIYARFVMMALKDFGIVSHSEPFKKLVHQGLITNKGAKMSKSKGNVVSPDAFVDKYGSDTFRMYLMFMGPFTDGGDWSDTGIKGIVRFVQRLFKTITEKSNKKVIQDKPHVVAALHRKIKKVGEDIEGLRFNTAISALMELLNLIEKEESFSAKLGRTIALLLTPLAPHLSEELWSLLGGKGFVVNQPWPKFDAELIVESTMTIVVQVNGKVRGDLSVSKDEPKESIMKKAKEIENVQKYLTSEIKKEIYVPGKLVSLVV